MPVRRSGLHERPGSEDFVMAWVSVPDLRLHASPQRYEHVRPGVVRYVALDGDFTAELELDDDGLGRALPAAGGAGVARVADGSRGRRRALRARQALAQERARVDPVDREDLVGQVARAVGHLLGQLRGRRRAVGRAGREVELRVERRAVGERQLDRDVAGQQPVAAGRGVDLDAAPGAPAPRGGRRRRR